MRNGTCVKCDTCGGTNRGYDDRRCDEVCVLQGRFVKYVEPIVDPRDFVFRLEARKTPPVTAGFFL
jgi:hypothetical protein